MTFPTFQASLIGKDLNLKNKIYVLIDPRDNTVRYVGKSTNPRLRHSSHEEEALQRSKGLKSVWIRELLDQNMRPVLKVVDSASDQYWEKAERRMIKAYRALGCLYNIQDGGLGPAPTVTAEVPRKKLVPSEHFKRRKKSRKINTSFDAFNFRPKGAAGIATGENFWRAAED